jgi:hypothetical protein
VPRKKSEPKINKIRQGWVTLLPSMNPVGGLTEERKGFSSFSQEQRTQLLRTQPSLVPTLYRK